MGTYKWVKYPDGKVRLKKVIKIGKIFMDNFGTEVKVLPIQRWKPLNNGKFLLNHLKHFESGLVLISYVPFENWVPVLPQELNLEEGLLSYLIGDYWVSEKGTHCFELHENGKNILLKDAWGSVSGKYKGRSIPSKENMDCLYYKRFSNKKGSNGIDYGVFHRNWTY